MPTLDNLKTQAKRWLKDYQAGNPSARQRLQLIYPQAPPVVGLRVIQHAMALERGYESWAALKNAPGQGDATAGRSAAASASGLDAAAAQFLEFACWDHRTHGRGDFAMHEAAAMRLLERTPAIATHSLETAIACGDLDRVRRVLAADPALINRKIGARGWEPLLYLCYARLPLPALRDRALDIAAALLDGGANPNAYYMAGDAAYTALVGVAGEGEQDAWPHVQRDALYRLLLERGALPYDIQVLYNTHFRGDLLWWLTLTYEHTRPTAAGAAWDDPSWAMFDMGRYGNGARFVLWTAIEKDNRDLAAWSLDRNADPNAAPAGAVRFSKRSLYEDALRVGSVDIAQLLLEHGAQPSTVAEPETGLLTAALRLDRDLASRLVAAHPELRQSRTALFTAARRDRVDAVGLLLDLGIPVGIADEHGEQALHVASGADALRTAALLLARGADPEARETRWDSTPLSRASYANHLEMIDLLTPVSRDAWTLSFRGKLERLREVLAADPRLARSVGRSGLTLLWWLPNDDETAARVVELLMANGADPNARSSSGDSAADFARKRGLTAAAALIDAAMREPQ